MAELNYRVAESIELQGIIDGVWELADNSNSARNYLGASALGAECPRMLWLEFRWVSKKKWDGRMLRLFDVGHREEDEMVKNLRAIGIDINFVGKDQLTLDFGGFIMSHPDGLIKSGVPTAEKTEHLWENKTMNKKNFDELVEKGVRIAKPHHYKQMQLEMLGTKRTLGRLIDRNLYTVICKDDSRIYCERVRLDKDFAERELARAKGITLSNEIPPKLSEDPTWPVCKDCSGWTFCHLSHTCTAVTCRSCAFGEPTEDSEWICNYCGEPVPDEVQRKGCRAHAFMPSLVPYKFHPEKSTDTCACFEMDNGELVLNGMDGIDSHELHSHSLISYGCEIESEADVKF